MWGSSVVGGHPFSHIGYSVQYTTVSHVLSSSFLFVKSSEPHAGRRRALHRQLSPITLSLCLVITGPLEVPVARYREFIDAQTPSIDLVVSSDFPGHATWLDSDAYDVVGTCHETRAHIFLATPAYAAVDPARPGGEERKVRTQCAPGATANRCQLDGDTRGPNLSSVAALRSDVLAEVCHTQVTARDESN